MSFSIVIPTMWKDPDKLMTMLSRYQYSVFVNEVLLIDNGGVERDRITFPKVKILNNGKNLFVNPSWNLGVTRAISSKVILANDDIYFDKIDRVLLLIRSNLREGMLIGLDKNCFKQRRDEEIGQLRISKMIGPHQYGFGTFMAFYKESYITIPEQLLVFYGDTFLCSKLEAYVIGGFDVQTEMRTTSKALDSHLLSTIKRKEKEYYTNLI